RIIGVAADGIRHVRADVQCPVAAQSRQDRLAELLRTVIKNAGMPWTPDTEEHRREAMDCHDSRLASLGGAQIKMSAHPVVERNEYALGAPCLFGCVEVGIARYVGVFGAGGDAALGANGPV